MARGDRGAPYLARETFDVEGICWLSRYGRPKSAGECLWASGGRARQMGGCGSDLPDVASRGRPDRYAGPGAGRINF